MKELRARTCTACARWMYDAGISLNAVNYDSFDTAIEAIGQWINTINNTQEDRWTYSHK